MCCGKSERERDSFKPYTGINKSRIHLLSPSVHGLLCIVVSWRRNETNRTMKIIKRERRAGKRWGETKDEIWEAKNMG